VFRFIALLTISCFLSVSPAVLQAAETSATATQSGDQATIRHFYDGLLATMKDGKKLGFSGRAEKLKPLVKETFSLPFMLQLIVGPKWNSIDKTQQDMVLANFTDWVTANYASQFTEFNGEKFEVDGTKDGGRGTTVVETKIVPSDDAPVPLGYRMLHGKVIDVYLNGSVSQLALWRSQFASVIKKDGVDGLIDRLKTQTTKLASS